MAKKAQKFKKPLRKFSRINSWMVVSFTLLFVVVVSFIASLQLKNYEKGIIEVYAVQQDGYVKLVLDQINIVKDRDETEIIEDILGSLDASTNRYWTLSDTESLIFVKDIMETNRYKGLTEEAYYDTASATEFILSLKKDIITHKTIEMDGNLYAASGVVFEYNGNIYRICLIAGVSSILNQNSYVNSKIILVLLCLAIVAAVVMAGFYLAFRAESWYKKEIASEKEISKLYKLTEYLNNEFTKDMFFQTQYIAFEFRALSNLLMRMEQKPIWPLSIEIVKCPEGEVRRSFFHEIQYLHDRKTMRVIIDDTYVMLLILKAPLITDDEEREIIENALGELVMREYLAEAPDMYLEAVVEKMIDEVKAHG